MTLNQAFEILKKAGGIRAARILTDNYKKVSIFRVLLDAYKLRHNVPVAKIIHEKWFYGLPFYTNRWTLDPRPDTETLVDTVIKEYKTKNYKNLKILDLGTGTGCLIAAIVKNIPNATGIGIDKSWHACRVARKNVKKFELQNKIKILNISFKKKKDLGKFDIIVSNPPYIAYGDKRVNEGAKFDPKMALYAKDNGLSAYKQIAKNAKNLLKPDGKIYLEIGANQELLVRKIFEHHGLFFAFSTNDLSNIERVLCFSL